MSSEQAPPRALLSPRGLALVLIIAGLMFSSVYPLRRYMAVREGITSLQQEEANLEMRIDELLAERERLLSDAEVERRAREHLGMVRPGEVPFVVAVPRQPIEQPDRVDPAGLIEVPPPDEDGLFERWWDAMRRALAG